MISSGRRHGRPPRLSGHDYSAPGVYFLTMCSWGRLDLFGRCDGGVMKLSESGRVVEEEWLRAPQLRPYVRLDAYVIMPDHLHGILIWDPNPNDFGVASRGCNDASSLTRPPRSLGSFVAGFKAICTKRINELRGGSEPPVWQRNYYEHVIRNQNSLRRIRRYILQNPVRAP
jgi:putative transposase